MIKKSFIASMINWFNNQVRIIYVILCEDHLTGEKYRLLFVPTSDTKSVPYRPSFTW